MDQDIRMKPKPYDPKLPELLCGQSSSLISLSILELFKIENWPTLEHFFLGFVEMTLQLFRALRLQPPHPRHSDELLHQNQMK